MARVDLVAGEAAEIDLHPDPQLLLQGWGVRGLEERGGGSVGGQHEWHMEGAARRRGTSPPVVFPRPQLSYTANRFTASGLPVARSWAKPTKAQTEN